MMIRDLGRVAMRSLSANRLRSALTMVGIVVGVAAVIAVMAVGEGARAAVAQQIRALGASLIIVTSGAGFQSGLRLGAGTTSNLSEADADAIQKEIPEAITASPFLRTQAQVLGNGANTATSVFGADNRFLTAREWDVEIGRLFDAEESRTGEAVALIGRTVAAALFPDQDPTDQQIIIRGVPLRIIGVLAVKGQSMVAQDQDDLVIVPIDIVRRRIIGGNPTGDGSVGAILVKAEDGAVLSDTSQSVRALLRQRHRLVSDQEDDFQLRNLTEIMNAVASSANAVSLLLAAVAAISLFVGGVGIMNMMLVAVTERIPEIGLRLAIGATRADILAQFLAEAGLLAATGGAVGVAIGWGLATVIAAVAAWPALIAPYHVLGALVFSAMVGLVFGFVPALRASRLDPIVALRSLS
jgi:putative ABC transport system permease protein